MTGAIETLSDLVREVKSEKTGGYDVDFEILPQREVHRSGGGFFLVIEVWSSNPGTALNGEWWFLDDDTVMQVL